MGFKIKDGVLAEYIPEKGVTEVVIPEGVKEIGWRVFEHCTKLKSVKIPDSVVEIGSSAFLGCKSLTSVIIPDSVTKIGSDAFSGCTSLTSVTIPDSVTTIGGWAFYRCFSLEKIVTPDFEVKVNDNHQVHRQVHLVASKDFYEKIPGKIKYDIILQMFLQKPDDEELLTYVKKNFTKALKSTIDNNDIETISAVCKRKDLLTKRNIDNLIEYAIQHTQNGGTVEIQALLMRYKNENIGFSTPSFRI